MDAEDSLILIKLYGENRHLWDPHCPDYTVKSLREDTWSIISRKMDIPILDLKRKLESLLGSYRREKSRERKSRLKKTGKREVYKSSWYAYDAFAYLEEREFPRNRQIIPDNETVQPVGKPPKSYASPKVKNLMGNNENETQAKRLREEPDEHECWALSCAADLKKMDPLQQIFAKNAFAAILMEGQLGLLERHSVKINESTHCNGCNCETQYLPVPVKYERASPPLE